MTRAESVVLALEACVKAGRPVSSDWYGNDSELLHQFATMVAAHEREACAQVCRDIMDDFWTGDDRWETARHCSEMILERGKK